MPIRPQHRWLYPIDWPQLSALIRFTRAKGCCEQCGRPHGQLIYHLGDGRWWDDERQVWRNGRGRVLAAMGRIAPSPDLTQVRKTKVYLATGHLDHDPTNNRSGNLKAFCQRCHMVHDKVEHQRRRWMTLRARRALGDLFLGPYRTT